MFAFYFHDQVFAKILELLSSSLLPNCWMSTSRKGSGEERGLCCLKSGFTGVQWTGYIQFDVMSGNR